MDHLTILLECPLYVTCHFITHCLSSACGRCYVCFVLRSCTLTGLKTKHTLLLPQVDDKRCSDTFITEGGSIKFNLNKFSELSSEI